MFYRTLLVGLIYVFFVKSYFVQGDPPEITLKPRNQSVKAGGVALFICSARGDPPSTIKWRKNGKKLAENSVLRIEPVRLGRDNATFECVAENGVGDAVSEFATLTVYEVDKTPSGFPTIISSSKTKSVELGYDTSLLCNTTGNPSPKIIWIKDNNKIDSSTNRRLIITESPMSSTLTILKSEPDDQGSYECMAENEVGTEFSKPTRLYVKERRVAPRFTVPPTSVNNVMLGSDLNLTCVATGAPVPGIKWRKGYLDLTSDDDVEYGKSVLKLKNIQESANYTCVAYNVINKIEFLSMVKVQSLPNPPTNLKTSEVKADSIRLSWSYEDGDKPHYYVIRYRPRYSNQEYNEISGIVSDHYIIQNLSSYMDYEFIVLGVNNIGLGKPSNPIVVTTGEKKPGTYPQNVQARPLSSSTMVVQWNEPEISNGQIIAYKIYYTTDPQQPLSSWQSQMVNNNQLTTISDLKSHETYTIRVEAYTSIGPGPLSLPVNVKMQQRVPSQPNNLKAVEISETSVKLAWDIPQLSTDDIVSYELYWNDTYSNEQHHRRITNTNKYTLTGLYPNTLYYVWLAARSQRGEGASCPSIAVRTKLYVPGAPPSNLTAEAVSATKIYVSWQPPPADQSNGDIAFYKLQYTESDQQDGDMTVLILNSTECTIHDLRPWTEYMIRVAASTSVGNGPFTDPITVRTMEFVPGNPQEVNAVAINSTTINVKWKPPSAKDRNGIIRGYHVHVYQINDQDKSLINEPMKFNIFNEFTNELNVSGLQPDTKYMVQIAALTRKGDGDRSQPVEVKTPGGVPNAPDVSLKILDADTAINIKVQWQPPTVTYGELLGFRLRYGVKNEGLLQQINLENNQLSHKVKNLEKGLDYEFRLSGLNHVGVGQETVKYIHTPEGIPTGPPTNISYHFQTPDVVCIMWNPPIREDTNGRIINYVIEFRKKLDQTSIIARNTTESRTVFSNLEEDSEYIYRVKAMTSQGSGPFSEKFVLKTARDMGRAPLSVRAMATSDSSVEVWWDLVPNRGKILGYQVFYTMTAVEDLDKWQHKTVPITESTELVNLEKFAQYAISIAVRTKNGIGKLSEKTTVRVKPEDVPLSLKADDVTTHSMTLSWSPPIRLNPVKYKIAFDSVKKFVDSEGITQTQIIPKREILLDASVKSHTVHDLSPFTTYHVNLSAIPQDKDYRPPTKIKVTTEMAAPQPMVKPDFHGVVNGEEIQVILPQASEEFGFIDYYLLIVVPEDQKTLNMDPDEFFTEDKLYNETRKSETEPYIAAKFPERSIPYTFHLGSGEAFEGGYINHKLNPVLKYRFFVRAVVKASRSRLYTSSPFSDFLSLDMREAPPGGPPLRPNPNVPFDTDVKVNPNHKEAALVWIIGPSIALFFLFAILIVLFMIKRRRAPYKLPDHASAARPLMSSDLNNSNIVPSDPVEIRRLNFQTPGMISHPPIPISEFANHVERLKVNDNLKFSQEYESIETGQQFTWDHSSMEINKPKNRYANVIAYDHSRVILEPEEALYGGDYINANYCDGYRKANAYVATQGPLQETFADFWRMCWQLRTATIVMMTKLEERARIKCDHYWPNRGQETYGKITVYLKEVQDLATYCIRTFEVYRENCSEKREIKQLQFTAWPDHGVPDHPAPFLQFLRRVRILNPLNAGPIVVHCSAGVGRTGCFIVIDSMLERVRQEKTIDIYGHVTCLRAQRNYMVQTEDQYVFIHDALLEAIVCGNTEVSARDLREHIQRLMQTEIGENITGMELEFKKLANIKTDSTRFMSANMPFNKHKNRLVHILPYDSTRVCLQPTRSIEGSDYINANFIDGYRHRNAYIATQGPLPDTVDDLWRMLWEHNSTIIVMLTKLKEMGREKCHQYWPSDRSVRYQCYVVEAIAEYNMPQYILREFKLTNARDGSSRTIRQFQFTDWPEQGVPKSGDVFIDFIGQVHKTKEQFGQDGPITVHCSAGVGRTGVFIALSIILERMQYEGVVDIFQTIRILRIQRPAMVQTEDQYQFCYRAALEYLRSFDHYTN